MTKFEFDVRDDEELTLRTAVYQAIGAASTCWENMKGTGVFDSDRAQDIAETLLAKIKELNTNE